MKLTKNTKLMKNLFWNGLRNIQMNVVVDS